MGSKEFDDDAGCRTDYHANGHINHVPSHSKFLENGGLLFGITASLAFFRHECAKNALRGIRRFGAGRTHES